MKQEIQDKNSLNFSDKCILQCKICVNDNVFCLLVLSCNIHMNCVPCFGAIRNHFAGFVAMYKHVIWVCCACLQCFINNWTRDGQRTVKKKKPVQGKVKTVLQNESWTKNELRKQLYRHLQTLGSQDSDTVVLFIRWKHSARFYIEGVLTEVEKIIQRKRATECCFKTDGKWVYIWK